jgi:hypothetical protein
MIYFYKLCNQQGYRGKALGLLEMMAVGSNVLKIVMEKLVQSVSYGTESENCITFKSEHRDFNGLIRGIVRSFVSPLHRF